MSELDPTGSQAKFSTGGAFPPRRLRAVRALRALAPPRPSRLRSSKKGRRGVKETTDFTHAELFSDISKRTRKSNKNIGHHHAPQPRAAVRAGIPGVAGRLGVPAKAINLLEEGIFVSRVSAIFWGVFFAFWGCICALGFFFFRSRASAIFWGELIF